MTHNRICASFALLILCAACTRPAQHDFASPPKGWRAWADNYSDREYPVVRAILQREDFVVNGRAVSRASFLRDLKKMSEVRGHPVIILQLGQTSLETAKPVMEEISATGFCDDASCYYQFNRPLP
jgi:hypothetical protein